MWEILRCFTEQFQNWTLQKPQALCFSSDCWKIKIKTEFLHIFIKVILCFCVLCLKKQKISAIFRFKLWNWSCVALNVSIVFVFLMIKTKFYMKGISAMFYTQIHVNIIKGILTLCSVDGHHLDIKVLRE